jgi:ribosomal protein L29
MLVSIGTEHVLPTWPYAGDECVPILALADALGHTSTWVRNRLRKVPDAWSKKYVAESSELEEISERKSLYMSFGRRATRVRFVPVSMLEPLCRDAGKDFDLFWEEDLKVDIPHTEASLRLLKDLERSNKIDLREWQKRHSYRLSDANNAANILQSAGRLRRKGHNILFHVEGSSPSLEEREGGMGSNELYEKAIKGYRKELSDLKRKVSDLESMRAAQQQQVNALRGDAQAAEKMAAEAEDLRLAMAKELDAVRGELEAERAKPASAPAADPSEIAQLKQEISSLKTILAQRETRITELEHEIRSKKTASVEVTAGLEDLDLKVAAIKRLPEMGYTKDQMRQVYAKYLKQSMGVDIGSLIEDVG